MDEVRFKELSGNKEAQLTKKEIEEGWRFCCEWDGLLINDTFPEAEVCQCFKTGETL